MISRSIADEVLDSWPPDFEIGGGDVVAMIREMPDRVIMPADGTLDRLRHGHRREQGGEPSGRLVPTFNEEMVRSLYAAVGHLGAVSVEKFGRVWPLENYTVLLTWHARHHMVGVAFCPRTDAFVQGAAFEVADGGMYANGPAVTFTITLPDYAVIRRQFMR